MIEWILIAIGVIIILLFFVARRKGFREPERRENSRRFFQMGLIWIVIAVIINGLVHPETFFDDIVSGDATLLNMGLIFFIAGLIGMGIEKYKK